MNARSTVRLGAAIAIAIACTAGGCTQTASFLVWQPAEIDTSGIQRLAVLDFRGADNCGQIARSALVSQLAGNGFYTLVDQAQLGITPTPGEGAPVDVHGAIQAAKAQGIDALLVGDVVSYDACDDVQRSQRIELGNAAERDGKHDKSINVFGVGIEDNETIDREVSASLAFQLIDVRTGQIRAARQTTHIETGQMTNGEGYLPARERALTELMHKCAQDIVYMLAPHQVPVEVDLAAPAWGAAAKEVRRGNTCALASDWTSAERHWQAAVELDPGSHAAMHNLAVANEAKQDYPRAEQLLADASKQKQTGLYARTRARVRNHKQLHLAVLAQRDARTPPATPPPPAYVNQPLPPGEVPLIGGRPSEPGPSSTASPQMAPPLRR